MSELEYIAALLGLINIALIVRRSVWNFPVGIAMVSLYTYIFYGNQLPSDAGLQIFFVVMNAYGWWAWSRNRDDSGELVVQRLGVTAYVVWASGSAAAILLWGSIMARYSSATHPYWDGAIAVLSVAAQILMTRRFIENWHWWIVVNIISIPLYVIKELRPTAILYGLFLILAIAGLLEWRRAARLMQQGGAANPSA